jgi:hypothetical protein
MSFLGHDCFATGSELVCSTTHLSIFGGIAEQVINTLACANAAALFSNNALHHISQGGWASTGPSCAVWATLSFLFVIVLVAALYDCRDYRTYDLGERGSGRGTNSRRSNFAVLHSQGNDAEDNVCLAWLRSLCNVALEFAMMLVEAGISRFKAMIAAVLEI